jgi:thioredoxin reductase (NADPH)
MNGWTGSERLTAYHPARIENYLGFPNGISGDKLSSRALRQASRFGAHVVVTRTVEHIVRVPEGYCVELDGGTRIQTRATIIATGVD